MLIYLASPFSYPDPLVRHERYQAACANTAWLMKGGLNIYSPIVHSYPLVAYGLPSTWDFWKVVDGEMLSRCDMLMVLMLPGWANSTGVREEIAIADALLIPVSYFAPIIKKA